MAAFSVSTVAGVPLSLFLANHIAFLGWRAPFIFIALLASAIFWLGYQFIPSIAGHLAHKADGNRFRQIYRLVIQRDHLVAFGFMALIMLTGFSVIPYIALYFTMNVGVPDAYISLVYLFGGIASLLSSRYIGSLADRYGKERTFRALAILSLVPIIVTTNLVPVPIWLVLINSTAFFILVSGRMIPAMAMVSQVIEPKNRGTFMSLIGSVQMLGSGIASVIAGMVITISPSGQIEHYNRVGYGAVLCGLLTFWLVGKIKPYRAPAHQTPS